MAGSYGHVVDEQGRLESNETVASMLENGGDVFEAVEEMYGMIWWLAATLSTRPDLMVEEARKNYREGLALSPGVKDDDE